MDLGLKDKVALVTGAGSQKGFGKGIALVLAKEGCHVIVSDIDLEGAKQTAAEIQALGRKAIGLKTDVTKSADVNDTVQAALKEFGRIDILVNNAGGSTPPKVFAETVEADWDKNLNLNLKGVLYCTKAVLPGMMARKSGQIVNISSFGGIGGVPTGTIYGAAKAGVINFSAGLAQEVGPMGIRVNCIAPSWGNTAFYDTFPDAMRERSRKMDEAGQTTKPEDMGNTVAFLASEVSKKIVGQCIRV